MNRLCWATQIFGRAEFPLTYNYVYPTARKPTKRPLWAGSGHGSSKRESSLSGRVSQRRWSPRAE